MTAVEELQAAIDKLTGLRDATRYSEDSGWLVEDVPGAEGGPTDPGYAPLTNDPLIVTLHRTIGPQLALLNEALGYATDWQNANYDHRGPDPQTVYRKELTLARAILAVPS